MKIINCTQGTPEWYAARCGVPSASNFDKIICLDGKPSKQRLKYLWQLAGEAITGIAEESYQNAAMERGKALETEARELYRIVTGNEVQEVGFCMNGGFGASPDGLVGEDGLLEIKCPSLATHVGYLLANELPSDYFQQTAGQLLVTGRKWCDFMSYYPGMKPLIVRVTPDKKFQAILEAELKTFCAELAETVGKIR
jgi:putative phage-type endonuclease